MVPEPGVEPGRACSAQGILSPLRLPIPPLRRPGLAEGEVKVEARAVRGSGFAVEETRFLMGLLWYF